MHTETPTRQPLTAATLKDIKAEFAALKPAKIALDSARPLSIKEAIFALAPTLERMKKRGFDTEELTQKLHEKGIPIKPVTLNKYLSEYRRTKAPQNTKATKEQKTKPKTDTRPQKTGEVPVNTAMIPPQTLPQTLPHRPHHTAPQTAPGQTQKSADSKAGVRTNKSYPHSGGFAITPDTPLGEL